MKLDQRIERGGEIMLDAIFFCIACLAIVCWVPVAMFLALVGTIAGEKK